MKKPVSVDSLDKLGRVQLSKTFFMRDFLFSDIAAIHGLSNVPDDTERAIASGRKLCQELLEPLQDSFGRLAIRSAYRSAEVNDFGNKNKLNCASNEANAAGHIWDMLDKNGHMGATACIIVPLFWGKFQAEGDWQKLAWWIHDHLSYSDMEFYPNKWAFNLTWHECPVRRISSYVQPKGVLTKPGMDNHAGQHNDQWRGIVEACRI